MTNRVFGLVAPWAPYFGVVLHTGRTSGRSYRTPVNVFPRPGGLVIALTYGPQSEWVRNVLASGRCDVIMRRRKYALSQPRLVHDPQRRMVPPIVRAALTVIDTADFLDLTLSQ